MAMNQTKNYGFLIEHGYTMRFYHVSIISFEKNHFDINEQIVKNVKELKNIKRYVLYS